MTKARNWRNEPEIPQSVIDFEQRLINTMAQNIEPPLGYKKTMQNTTMVVNVLKSLIEECEANNVTHLPVHKLKTALERWL